MQRPEKQFWTYIALISSVLLLGLSGQLISCAKAETVRNAPAREGGRVHPIAQPGAPWNHEPPMVSSRPGVHVEAQLDRGSIMQYGPGIVRVEVRMDTPAVASEPMQAGSDIVVVVDTSGSMEGEKLQFAKQALFELFERLGPDDRFGLVQYNTDAETLISLQPATERAKSTFRSVTAHLIASGSTNMSAGLDRGRDLLSLSADRHTPGRLVLLSDGLANAGDASPYGLSQRARHLSQAGHTLSTMGIGEDFDESLMTTLATSGAGAFYYLAKLAYLPEFLESELASTRETYALSAALQFSPAAGVQLVDAMGLDVVTRGGDRIVRLGSLYSGRNRSVWLTLKVPSTRMGSQRLGHLSLSYDRHSRRDVVTIGDLPTVLCLQDRQEYERSVKKDVWERALLNNVFSKAEEDFGDAIRTGDRRIIEQALTTAEEERKLAQSLGSTKVLERLDDLKGRAVAAEQAQAAPTAVRNQEAKKAKARGYQQRNSSSYKSVDSAMRAY